MLNSMKENHHNILNPFSFEINLNHSRDLISQFTNEIFFHTPQFAISFDALQMNSLSILGLQYSKFCQRRLYSQCGRPNRRPRSPRSSGLWWRFAHRCAITIQHHITFDPKNALQLLKNRKRYLELYKKKLILSPKAFEISEYDKEIRDLEESLELTTVIFLRSYAKKQEEANLTRKLNAKEIRELIKESPHEQLFGPTKFNFKLDHFVISLFDANCTQFLKLDLTNLVANYFLNPNNVLFSLKIHSFKIYNDNNSLYPIFLQSSHNELSRSSLTKKIEIQENSQTFEGEKSNNINNLDCDNSKININTNETMNKVDNNAIANNIDNTDNNNNIKSTDKVGKALEEIDWVQFKLTSDLEKKVDIECYIGGITLTYDPELVKQIITFIGDSYFGTYNSFQPRFSQYFNKDNSNENNAENNQKSNEFNNCNPLVLENIPSSSLLQIQTSVESHKFLSLNCESGPVTLIFPYLDCLNHPRFKDYYKLIPTLTIQIHSVKIQIDPKKNIDISNFSTLYDSYVFSFENISGSLNNEQILLPFNSTLILKTAFTRCTFFEMYNILFQSNSIQFRISTLNIFILINLFNYIIDEIPVLTIPQISQIQKHIKHLATFDSQTQKKDDNSKFPLNSNNNTESQNQESKKMPSAPTVVTKIEISSINAEIFCNKNPILNLDIHSIGLNLFQKESTLQLDFFVKEIICYDLFNYNRKRFLFSLVPIHGTYIFSEIKSEILLNISDLAISGKERSLTFIISFLMDPLTTPESLGLGPHAYLLRYKRNKFKNQTNQTHIHNDNEKIQENNNSNNDNNEKNGINKNSLNIMNGDDSDDNCDDISLHKDKNEIQIDDEETVPINFKLVISRCDIDIIPKWKRKLVNIKFTKFIVQFTNIDSTGIILSIYSPIVTSPQLKTILQVKGGEPIYFNFISDSIQFHSPQLYLVVEMSIINSLILYIVNTFKPLLLTEDNSHSFPYLEYNGDIESIYGEIASGIEQIHYSCSQFKLKMSHIPDNFHVSFHNLIIGYTFIQIPHIEASIILKFVTLSDSITEIPLSSIVLNEEIQKTTLLTNDEWRGNRGWLTSIIFNIKIT